MSRVPSKHGRDQSLDFEGFLNNLQDWELSLKDKDKKLKSQPGQEKMDPAARKHTVRSSSNIGVNGRTNGSKEPGGGTSKIEIVGADRRLTGKTASVDYTSTARQEDYLGNYDAVSRLSSNFMTEDSTVDANSEKELGNEFFKQKKFKEAIDCYSRSLALSPTAVAYANRAMAYLKVKRFQEAEDDCTEALNLDDRYIKAFSRRSTARKELGKFKECIDDAEFALRLEPQNQEIKKQYAEAKSMYEKEILKKASEAVRNSTQAVEKEGKSDKGISFVPKSSQVTKVAATQGVEKEGKSDMGISFVPNSSQMTKVAATQEETKTNHSAGEKDLKASVQQLAARAASLATAEAAKNIVPPTSAYQFEVSWRGFSGDRTLQARLMKATSPVALPQIFKNALSAPLLIDIIRCITTFFSDEVDLAVKYLENLSKVSRFDMIIMCLSSTDKADLQRMWDEVFCNKGTPPEYSEILHKLRSKYCLKC